MCSSFANVLASEIMINIFFVNIFCHFLCALETDGYRIRTKINSKKLLLWVSNRIVAAKILFYIKTLMLVSLKSLWSWKNVVVKLKYFTKHRTCSLFNHLTWYRMCSLFKQKLCIKNSEKSSGNTFPKSGSFLMINI